MRLGWRALFVVSFALSSAALPAFGQWPKGKTPAADPNAPPHRTADGKPDLSGIWEPNGAKYLANIAADLKPEDIPFTPQGAALFKLRGETFGKDDPDARCLPSGMPRKDAIPSPYKIVQTPALLLVLYESRTTFRQIYLDGRPFPEDPQPTWDGYSVGHWDGDTLVVESTGFSGKAWLDSAGHPISDALRLTEKFRRPGFGNLEIEITINDPKMYTRPWTVKENPHLLADTELIEYICNENEKDLSHLVGK